MHAWVQSKILADHSETTYTNTNFRGTSYGRVRPTRVFQTVPKEEVVPRQPLLGKSKSCPHKTGLKTDLLDCGYG